MSAGIIIVLLLALMLVIFTLQNSILVDLHVLFWQLTDVPLVLALLVCVISGIILGMIIYHPKLWKLKARLREQQKLVDQYKARQLSGTEKESSVSENENKPFKSDFFSEE